MKNLKIILSMVLACASITAKAHNPLAATYYLEASDELSVLNIYLAQAGLHQAIIHQHGEQELTDMSLDDYKQTVVDYVRDNFSLVIDGAGTQLLEGGIKLGSHQTNLKFLISTISPQSVEMAVSVPAFADNEGHQTVFSYLIHGHKGKVILDTENNYTSQVKLDKDVVSAQMPSITALYPVIMMVLLLGLSWWLVPRFLRINKI